MNTYVTSTLRHVPSGHPFAVWLVEHDGEAITVDAHGGHAMPMDWPDDIRGEPVLSRVNSGPGMGVDWLTERQVGALRIPSPWPEHLPFADGPVWSAEAVERLRSR
jgi:hypothetical protein